MLQCTYVLNKLTFDVIRIINTQFISKKILELKVSTSLAILNYL